METMTQEDKDLLLKDLCARLPYDVKVNCNDKVYNFAGIHSFNICILSDDNADNAFTTAGIKYIKPYLFPLSSITIEQERELSKLGVSYGEYALHDDIRGLGIMVDEAYIFFKFCYNHHIDFLGLIEMGLAIDATGKNIY